VNALSFVASLSVGIVLGEKIPSKKEMLGLLLVLGGVLITLL
jgi:drug/metabolite transporter (DMT)-like permease